MPWQLICGDMCKIVTSLIQSGWFEMHSPLKSQMSNINPHFLIHKVKKIIMWLHIITDLYNMIYLCNLIRLVWLWNFINALSLNFVKTFVFANEFRVVLGVILSVTKIYRSLVRQIWIYDSVNNAQNMPSWHRLLTDLSESNSSTNSR